MVRKSVWLVSAGLFALAAPAQAQQTDTDQDAAQPTEGATIEAAAVDNTAVEQQPVDGGDIIVTATRRNEALSDVPLAVSAITAETLENTGATDIRQMQQVSPSLLVTSTQSEAGASTARIRGIGTVGDNPGLESSVGVFIDGVYRSRTGVGLTELGPLDRVEVLRGPQGTLFGRNTSAGLISIITAKPRFQTAINGQLDIGNYNLRRIELGITGPLSDTIAARLDGVYLKRDGYVEDLISGRDVNNRDRWLLRGQVLFQPTDAFSLRVIGDYSKRNEECCAAPYLPASDFTAAGRVASTIKPLLESPLLGGIVPDHPFDRKVVISPGRSYRGDVKDWGLSAEAVYDFGGAELTSISAYRDNDLRRGTDVDYSNVDIVYRDDKVAFNRFKTFTQELRLQGEALGGKLDWLVGGYYAHEKLQSLDTLRYGRDYDAYTNCLTAASFAARFAAVNPVFAGLIDPTQPTCFNPTLAGIAEPFVPLSQLTAFQAFTRRGVFAAPIFTNSGLENLVRGLVPGAGGFLLEDRGFTDDFKQSANNLALFTHNIFSITEQLKLTIGARYTTETKRLNAGLVDNNLACVALSGTALAGAPCVIPGVPGGLLDLNGKRKENKLSGTAVLSYKPTDDILTYASYSRGYKAGGFNLDRTALTRQTIVDPATGQPIAGAICLSAATPGCAKAASADDLEFKPETNDAFELGMKYNGRGIDVNVAVFHQQFKNFQLNTFNGVNFLVENINSCSEDLNGEDTDNNPFNGACDGKLRSGVRSQGVEVELFSRPIPNVSFNLGVTYADTKYRKNLVGAGGRGLTNALFQLPGRRVSNSSLWTVTSSLAWTPPIGNTGLSGLFYIDMRRQSSLNTGSDLDIEKVENGYMVFNGRVGIRGPDAAWALELWAQNLTNEKVKQIAFDALLQGSGTQRGVEQGFYSRSTQLYGVFLGEPRTYGLTLRAKFGPSHAPEPVAEAPPPPPPPPPATQTCADGSVILATDACPLPPPPPPPPAPEPERG
ncbi:MAG: TonB-dependent receptor [Sphingomicrobium sp.]